jgi:hypothetical protein
MAKITIEMNDELPDLVNDAIESIKEMLTEYVKENDSQTLPCLNNDLDYNGSVHELVDGLVPVYTKELNDIWYLHKQELIDAYNDAGIGNDPTEKDGAVAIYCYLLAEVNNWYHKEAKDYFEEIIEEMAEDVVDD